MIDQYGVDVTLKIQVNDLMKYKKLRMEKKLLRIHGF